MRDLRELDSWRVRTTDILQHYGSYGDGGCGVFEIPFGGWMFLCVASDGDGWDHVSISTHKRCPSWTEMDFLKRRFFKDDEVAMQLHVTPKDHISIHPYTLHLWRPHNLLIPLPPSLFV